MQELATTEQQTAPAPQKPSKQPRIPKAIRHACRLLMTGECTTVKAAAQRAGISREWLSRNLSRDHIRVFVDREARETIAIGKMTASARMLELVHADSEHVSADVSKHLLAIAGIKPAADAQVNVNIELKAGYVIDLTGRKPRAEQIIEQNQIEALPTVGRDDGADG